MHNKENCPCKNSFEIIQPLFQFFINMLYKIYVRDKFSQKYLTFKHIFVIPF